MKSFAILFTAACLLGPSPTYARVLLTQKSLYRNITVTDDGTQRCLKFSIHRDIVQEESCIYDDDHDRLVFDYTRLALVGLLLDPNPRKVLIAGLGGGVLPHTLHELYPDARIDTVEIDPAVVDVAEHYFDYKPDAKQHVIVSDARVDIKRAIARGDHYDMIILDAFNGDYIPPHLMTVEFLHECRRLLTPRGVLVANTFSTSKLYDSESVTYQKAFGWFLNLRRVHGNRIILTRKSEPVSPSELQQAAQQYTRDLTRFGVDLNKVAAIASNRVDWDPDARVLTDQYSPVNLLNGPRRSGHGTRDSGPELR